MRRPPFFVVIVVLLVFFVALVACAESSSTPPPTAPTATPSLDVPPLPTPKPIVKAPDARQPVPAAPAADDSDETPRPRDLAAAESAFQDAKRAMAAGDHVKACGLFRQSLRFDRAIGTLLNLALCEEKLGERSNALKHYLAAEAEATKNGQHDRAAFARERAAALMAGP